MECSLAATIAAQMMVGTRYHLALIDAVLPDTSGVALAGLAAGQNTPALLISGRPDVIDKLGRFGFPTLRKPFVSSRLIAEARRVMSRGGKYYPRQGFGCGNADAHTGTEGRYR